jgi:hypothetical protein
VTVTEPTCGPSAEIPQLTPWHDFL